MIAVDSSEIARPIRMCLWRRRCNEAWQVEIGVSNSEKLRERGAAMHLRKTDFALAMIAATSVVAFAIWLNHVLPAREDDAQAERGRTHAAAPQPGPAPELRGLCSQAAAPPATPPERTTWCGKVEPT